MRFTPSSIEAMRKGHKTQTRRLRKSHQSHNLDYVGIVAGFEGIPQKVWNWDGARLRWKVGNRYAIQPAGKRYGAKAVGSFLCTSLKAERLQDISEEDAIAEGIRSVQPLYDCRLYTNGIDGIVYTTPVLAFECLWEIINNKPRMRWADNPEVWVIGMDEFKWEKTDAPPA